MKNIENNLLAVFNAMIKNKSDWRYVTDKQKEDYFFICNRLFSKEYLELAQYLNMKTTDKIQGMDLWYYFMLDKPYPSKFWSKNTKEESKLTSTERYDLLKKYNIREDDLEYLVEYHYDFIKEELKFIKKLKENGK